MSQQGKATASPRGLMARIKAPEPEPPWLAQSALIFVGAYVALWIAMLSIVSTSTGEIYAAAPSTRTLALSALGSGLVITIGLIQWARRARWKHGPYGQDWLDAFKLRLPTQRNTLFLIGLICLGIAFAVDLGGILLKLKEGQVLPTVLGPICRPDNIVPQPGQPATACQPEAVSFLVALILAIVVQPIAEGLVFYGVLYPSMTRAFPGDNRIAVLVVALVYMGVSLVLSASPGQWYSALQPFFMALTVASVRAYYQSTRAAIAARIAFGVFFVLAGLLSSGFVAVPVPQ